VAGGPSHATHRSSGGLKGLARTEERGKTTGPTVKEKKKPRNHGCSAKLPESVVEWPLMFSGKGGRDIGAKGKLVEVREERSDLRGGSASA